MALTIWKTVLAVRRVQDIEVPEGAEFLCAREQHGETCVWYRCDPSAPKTMRRIAIVGTGNAAPQPSESRYLGMASLDNGHTIHHVFVQPY